VNRTDRIIEQGKALVRAIEALETIEPTGPIERVQAWFLLQAYRRRLRAIVEAAPDWVVEEIVSASQHIEEGRPAVWLSKN
jgi:hypothetical protein